MLIDIPKRNNFLQGNDGELGGSLSRTFNIDLGQDKGKLTLSRRLNINTTTSDEASLTYPTSFAFYNDRYYAIGGGTIYKSDSDTNGDPSVEMSPDSDTGVPSGFTTDEDLIAFNGKLYSVSGDIHEKSGSTWTNVDSSPGAGFHSTAVYAERLYFSDSTNSVYSMDTSNTVDTSGPNTLDLTNGKLVISCIRSATDGIWIATVNKEGGRARMFKWDGVTENTVDNSYVIPDVGVKNLVIYNDRPYIVTSRGLVMTFNGSFFEEVARFPFYYDIKAIPTRVGRDSWIHDNCSAVIDNKIHFIIANRPLDDDAPINDSNRSYGGVWVLDEDFGLYHKYALSSSSPTSDNINTHVDINKVGAIYPAALDVNSFEFEEYGKFICGAEFYSDATTKDDGIFSAMEQYEEGNASSYSTYTNQGWFVTSQIQAEQLTESWQQLSVAFKKFANSTDKIVIKARDNEDDYVDSTITWTSTTTFTSTDSDWGTIETNFDAGTDYETTILRGKGAGMCAHITDISEAGGTYTVTVDETHTGATTGTAKVRVEKWNKVMEVTDTTQTTTFDKKSIGLESTWVQIKVFISGKGASPTIERLVVKSEPSVLLD